MTVDGGFSSTELWGIVRPKAATNLVTNPSFEVSTAGWTASGGTLVKTAGAGSQGAYGGRILASALNGGASMTLESVASGSIGVASGWVRVSSPLAYIKIAIGATEQIAFHPGDGEWHRISATITAPSTTTPVITFADSRGAGWTNMDVDGIMFETLTGDDILAGVEYPPSTYVDGDQDGCSWTGVPHLSKSIRDARDGRGGDVLSFESLGFFIESALGQGAPPVDLVTQDPASGDGELYQRSRNKARVLTLQGKIIGNGTPQSLHAIRRGLEGLILPDARKNRAPITLWYRGSTVPRHLRAAYLKGFEMEGIEAGYEKIPLSFQASDPDWLSLIDTSYAMTVGQSLSPVSQIAMQKPDGSWTSLGGGMAAGTNTNMTGAVELLDGRVVVAGNAFLDLGGVTTVDNMGVWNGTTFAIVGSAIPNGVVQAMAVGNLGELYITGAFTTVGGVTINGIGMYTPSTNTWVILGTGGLQPQPNFSTFNSLAVDPSTGYLWGAGSGPGSGVAHPTTAGGVTINGLGYWNGTTWVAVSQTGLPSGWGVGGVQGLIFGPDGRAYMAVTSATTKGIYVFDGAAWNLVAASGGASNGVFALLSARGKLYAGGYFTSMGGVAVNNVAEIVGTGISSMNGGILVSTTIGVRSLAMSADGLIHAAGESFTSMGGVSPIDSIGTWNGSSWQPFPANPPDTASHATDRATVYSTRSGNVVVSWSNTAGTFGTSMPVEAVTTVVNGGTENAFPTFEFAGAGTLYTLANLTTGQRINFNGCILSAGETARLDLRQGKKTFATIVRSLLWTVLPGSDLATFFLAPGENRLSMMMSGGSGNVWWRGRAWTAD